MPENKKATVTHSTGNGGYHLTSRPKGLKIRLGGLLPERQKQEYDK